MARKYSTRPSSPATRKARRSLQLGRCPLGAERDSSRGLAEAVGRRGRRLSACCSWHLRGGRRSWGGNQRELSRQKNMKKAQEQNKGKRKEDALSASQRKQRDSEIMQQKQKAADEKKTHQAGAK